MAAAPLGMQRRIARHFTADQTVAPLVLLHDKTESAELGVSGLLYSGALEGTSHIVPPFGISQYLGPQSLDSKQSV